MGKRRKIWEGIQIAILGVALAAFALSAILGLLLFAAAAGSTVWPGSQEMANIVKADWLTLGFSLAILLTWPWPAPQADESQTTA